MEEKKYLNIAEFARKIGVSRPAISKAIKNGRLRLVTQNGKRLLLWPEQRDVYLQISSYAANLNNPEKKESISDNPEIEKKLKAPIENYNDARFQTEAYRAKMARLEYEEHKGQLVSVKEVRRIWGNLGSELKKSILSIPDRVGPILAGESDPQACKIFLKQELINSLRTIVSANINKKKYGGDLDLESEQNEINKINNDSKKGGIKKRVFKEKDDAVL